MKELLMDMAQHDNDNAEDLRAFRRVLDKTSVEKRVKKRMEARAQKAVKRKEKAARVQAQKHMRKTRHQGQHTFE